MSKSLLASLILAASLVTVNGSAIADDHDNHRYAHHDEWSRGARMRHEDWNRGERVGCREHHLRAPPRGYEWRQVDGNYILAAVTTGMIASVVAASLYAH